MIDNISISTNKKLRNYSTLALALFYTLLPFEYPLASLGVNSIIRYIGILSMGLSIIDIIINEKYKIRIDYRHKLLLCWLLLVFVSYLWSEGKQFFETYALIYLRNALMFLLISCVKYTRYEEKIIRNSYVLGGVFLLLYMTFVPGAVTYSAWQKRLTLAAGDTTLDQNYLAVLIAIPFAFVFYDFINNHSNNLIKRILMIIFCFGCLYYIIATGSRTGLLSITIMSLLSLKLNTKKNIIGIIITIALLFIVFPVIYQLMPSNLLDRFTVEAFTGRTGESGARLIIWKAAMNDVSFDPALIIGHGAGSAQVVVSKTTSHYSAIHNHYISQFIELGLVGITVIMTFMIKMLINVYVKRRDVAIAFLGIFIAAFFIDVLTTKSFWAIIIYVSIVISSYKSEESLND